MLLALARAHAVYSWRDMAAVLRSLRFELAGRDHPVDQAIDEAVASLLTACVRLVRGGRRRGSIPPGPPVRDTAAAWCRAPCPQGAQHLADQMSRKISICAPTELSRSASSS